MPRPARRGSPASQQVVEVVGDAPGQHAEALQLLRLAQGFLAPPPLGNVREHHQPLVADDGRLDLQVRGPAVLAHHGVLGGRHRRAGGRRLGRGLGPVRGGPVPQVGVGVGLLPPGFEVRQVPERVAEHLLEPLVHEADPPLRARHADGDRGVRHQGPEPGLALPLGRQGSPEALPLSVVLLQDHPENDHAHRAGQRESRDHVDEPALGVREGPDQPRAQPLDPQEGKAVGQVEAEHEPARAALEEDHQVHGGRDQEHADAALRTPVAEPDEVEVRQMEEEEELHAVVPAVGRPEEAQAEHPEGEHGQVHEPGQALGEVQGDHHQDRQEAADEGEPPEQALLDGRPRLQAQPPRQALKQMLHPSPCAAGPLPALVWAATTNGGS